MNSIDVAAAFATFDERWAPRRLARLNDYDVRIAKIEGEFLFHKHDDTDELFVAWKGSFDMHYRDKVVAVPEGAVHVVPKGVEHKPVAREECWIMLIEVSDTANTGDAGGERTRTVAEL